MHSLVQFINVLSSIVIFKIVIFSLSLSLSLSHAALKTKLVSARMDQNQRKVYVTSRVHRTFGRTQWQTLHDTLTGWKSNLALVKESMQAIVTAPIVPAK